MKAQSMISLWDHQTAVSIPPDLLLSSGLQVGQPVEVELSQEGALIVRPVRDDLPKLEALLARITPENLPDREDVEWGGPAGSELW
jgi:antitoxin component of MazEF toxin-antitoxin module